MSGPNFLYLPESSWPPLLCHMSDLDGDLEGKVFSLAVTIREPNAVDKLLSEHSFWYGLQRMVAWLHRFVDWVLKSRPNISGPLIS